MDRLQTWHDAIDDWLPSTEGLMPIFHKEMGDHLNSYRFLIIFAIVALASLSSAYVASQTLGETLRSAQNQNFVFTSNPFAFLRIFTTSSGQLLSFVSFVSFLAPLIGISLGFDAVNSERNTGNLSRVISQPVYRDSIINGKFLAGLAIIALMVVSLVLLVAGLGLLIIGIPPAFEEAARMFFFALVTVIYVGFWLALAILFSVLFRESTTSALATIGIWLFLTLFATLLAGMVADALVPLTANATMQTELLNLRIETWIRRLSPNVLYQEATTALLTPEVRTLGPVSIRQLQEGALPTQLPLGQSLLLIWPHLVALIGGTMALFAIAYRAFIRQEIRAT